MMGARQLAGWCIYKSYILWLPSLSFHSPPGGLTCRSSRTLFPLFHDARQVLLRYPRMYYTHGLLPSIIWPDPLCPLLLLPLTGALFFPRIPGHVIYDTPPFLFFPRTRRHSSVVFLRRGMDV